MLHKFLKVFLAIALLALSGIACRALSLNSGPSLEGTWRGEYEGFEIILTFNENGSMVGYFNEDTGVGTYEANYSTSPHELDMVYEDQDAPVQTIFEFIDDNTLRMENNSPGDSRPSSFSDYIVMQRDQ